MSHRVRVAGLALACAGLLAGAALPRPAEAGVSEATLALAAPLAQQFGVPGAAVTSLLQSGVSVESVAQLLLVKQSAKAELDDVTGLYRGYGNDITKTAEKLEVDASAYSKDKVTAALDQARTSAAESATQKAADEANKAIGGALGGLRR